MKLPKLSQKQVATLLAYYLAGQKKNPLLPKRAPVWQLEMAVKGLNLCRMP